MSDLPPLPADCRPDWRLVGVIIEAHGKAMRAGFSTGTSNWGAAIANEVRAYGEACALAEREACAKVCEARFGGDAALVGNACARRIRARATGTPS